jgi:predicted O-methyltransferase YrrM
VSLLEEIIMNQVNNFAKSVVPARLRHYLRQAHRELVFRRAMKRFLDDPDRCSHPGNPVLLDLIYGWGNESWSAQDEYLADCLRNALVSCGSILECGSGLSTILTGSIAQKRGQRLWALEHTPEWATRVQEYLSRYKIDSVVMCINPLKDYGAFCWYDVPLESMPDRYTMVICDGPPGMTKGGRYGLLPVMRKRLKPGCVILLDDADREQERAIASRWATECGAFLEEYGSTKPYIKMTVRHTPHPFPP